MLKDLKYHITIYNGDEFKQIGAGTYSDAFKFYYDKNKCPNIKTTGSKTDNKNIIQSDTVGNGLVSKFNATGITQNSQSLRSKVDLGLELNMSDTNEVIDTVYSELQKQDKGIETIQNFTPTCLDNIDGTVQEDILLCANCKLYPTSGLYVIKEIQKTHRYSQSDFDSEIHNHMLAISYMPDLIVNMYQNWNEIFTICEQEDTICTGLQTQGNATGLELSVSGTDRLTRVPTVKKLGNRNTNNGTILDAYCYITLEYMNYKDLYLNYRGDIKKHTWIKPINMVGLLFICLVILYNLHCKLSICHGDFRDTNIFLNYIGPEYKQSVRVEFEEGNIEEFNVNTGGFHIKLGDFGLADLLIPNTKSFIFRDYEFMENIYKNREWWMWMTDRQTYERLIMFLRLNFINNINRRMDYYNYKPELSKSRTEFWFAKHSVSEKSSYLTKYPKQLLLAYITEFADDFSKC